MDPVMPPVALLANSVVLSGPALDACLNAVLVAVRARRRNGLPVSELQQEIAAALMSANGHADVRETVIEAYSEQPDMPIEEASQMLGLSARQTRRCAAQLGGQIIGGRWMLDRQSVFDWKESRCPQ